MTSKQRAYIRGLAMNTEPLIIIGKNGVTDNLIEQINDLLEARELIKISVLKNADFSAKQIAETVAEATGSILIQTVGSKITLYRVSKKEGIKHIVIPQ